MGQFLGTHQVRLDAKGRVSVPAPFRAVLRAVAEKADAMDDQTLVLWPSYNLPCIEAWPKALFGELLAPFSRDDIFSDLEDAKSAVLYAEAMPMDPDKEGRIVLPENLVAHAGLTEGVAFVGAGRQFRIWEPAKFQDYLARARDRARALSQPAAA